MAHTIPWKLCWEKELQDIKIGKVLIIEEIFKFE